MRTGERNDVQSPTDYNSPQSKQLDAAW